MRNSEYWAKRMMDIEDARHRDAKRCVDKVLTSFTRARIDINKEIAKWLGRIATNEGISMAEARKRLKGNELEEFGWDLAEYRRIAKDEKLSKEWAKKLENASARVHITRWEAMNMAIEQYLQRAYGTENNLLNDLLKRTASEAYTRTAYGIENGLGMGRIVNVPKLDVLVRNPWAADRRIFSDRIWGNLEDTKNALQDALICTTLRGGSPDEAIKIMETYVKDGVEDAARKAERLVYTENAAISEKAKQACYEDLDVEEFEIVATLDSITCTKCGDKDDLHYPMDMYKVGSTVPPFHARCRCTTAPYIEGDEIAERMMRNPKTGKAEYIPNMSYNEWRDKYLKLDEEA